MQLQALKKVAPLVANHVRPWRPDPDRQDVIIGEYAEDGSHYTVIVPTKLREAILAMHNETLQQANLLRMSLLRAEQAQKGSRTCAPPTAQPTDEPTVPGTYWVRAHGETITAKINKIDIQTGVFAFNGKHTYDACCRFDEAKFSGPIQPPEGW